VGAQEFTLEASGNCWFGLSLWDFKGRIGKKRKYELRHDEKTMR